MNCNLYLFDCRVMINFSLMRICKEEVSQDVDVCKLQIPETHQFDDYVRAGYHFRELVPLKKVQFSI